jgi:cytochrome P450
MRRVARPASSCSDLSKGFDPLHGEQVENPYPFYARARKEQPVFFNSRLRTWYVTRYADIVAILNDPIRFASVELFDYPDLTADNNQSSGQSQRSVVNNSSCTSLIFPLERISDNWIRRAVKAALAGQIDDLEARVSAIAMELIDGFANRGSAEFVRDFGRTFSTRVIFDVIGVPPNDVAQLKRWETDWMEVTTGHLAQQARERAVGRLTECQRYWLSLIEDRASHPRADLISCLIAASREEPTGMNIRQIENACTVLSLAGHETTTNLLSISLFRLLSMPEQWRLLCQDRTLIPRAIEEVLRIETSVPASMRTTTEAVEVGGIRIPQGARLALLFASANHDEVCFHDPAKFDLHRQDSASHIAFGRGLHFCLGAQLARLEVRLALELMIERLPGLRLAPGRKFTFLATPAHRGLRDLHIEWNT